MASSTPGPRREPPSGHARPGPEVTLSSSPDNPRRSPASPAREPSRRPAAAPSDLQRALGPVHATAMVVGTIIGASIFVQPSEITGQVPTLTGAALVWGVAGIMTLLGALATAELAARLPECGGVYAFLREAWSPALGFLWGWAMFWTMHSGIIAAIAVVFARYLGYFVPLGDAGGRVVAIGVIAVLTAINYVGVRRAGDLQAAFTVAKVGAIVLVIVLGVVVGPRHEVAGAGQAERAAAVGPAVPEGATASGPAQAPPAGSLEAWIGGGPGDFLLALVAGLFAFGGWHMVTYNAEETRDPERTIPRALVLGVPIVTVCYVALNAVYFHVLPLETVIGSTRVAADAAEAMLGRGGGGVMSGLVVFSTFGALSGIVLAGPRVYYAMARDGLAFRWLAGVHPRFRTPHRAILLQGAWASVLVATGTYRALFTRVVYTEWIFFGLMVLGLFRLRRGEDGVAGGRGTEADGRGEGAGPGGPAPGGRDGAAGGGLPGRAGGRRRPSGYRMWGFPATALLFAAAAFAIVANQVVTAPLESAVGLGLVLLGLPVYALWTGRRGRPSGRPSPPEGSVP